MNVNSYPHKNIYLSLPRASSLVQLNKLFIHQIYIYFPSLGALKHLPNRILIGMIFYGQEGGGYSQRRASLVG